jgi:hypothetical protein
VEVLSNHFPFELSLLLALIPTFLLLAEQPSLRRLFARLPPRANLAL